MNFLPIAHTILTGGCLLACQKEDKQPADWDDDGDGFLCATASASSSLTTPTLGI